MLCIECTLLPKNQYYFTVPAKKIDGFPNKEMPVKLIYKNKPYPVKFYKHDTHHGFSCLAELFKDNIELYSINTVKVCIIQQDKSYSLEIVK